MPKNAPTPIVCVYACTILSGVSFKGLEGPRLSQGLSCCSIYVLDDVVWPLQHQQARYDSNDKQEDADNG